MTTVKHQVRFRVNPKLITYFNRKEINKTVFSNSLKNAKVQADVIKLKYNQLLSLCLVLDDAIEIQKQVDRFIIDTLELERTASKAIPKVLINRQNKESEIVTLEDALNKYIRYYEQEAQSNNTDIEQVKDVKSFLYEIFLEQINVNPTEDIKLITIDDCIQFKELVSIMPIRKYKPFNRLTNNQIFELITNKSKKVALGDYKVLSKSTINKYLGYTKSFFEYLRNVGLIDVNPLALIKTTRGGINAQAERHPLSLVEINHLLQLTTDNPIINNAIKVFYTSGMRLSELYKAKLTKIDGIDVFDLRGNDLKLKTSTSHRVIPIHSSVNIELLNYLPKLNRLSKIINSIIREHISNDNRKVLYSLRHSFATTLKNLRVEHTIISELMGHSHQGMTFGRYAKAYDIEILKESIEKLKI